VKGDIKAPKKNVNVIGIVAMPLFFVGWVLAVGVWFNGAYHMVKARSEVRVAGTPSHLRKALLSGAMFAGCWLFVMANGLIMAFFGGLPHDVVFGK